METINMALKAKDKREQKNIVDWDVNTQIQNILKMESRNLNYEKVAENIVNQLQEYLITSKQKGFTLWVSGWIDSAVVSTLAALSGAQTLVMDLPIHQKQDEVNRASDHMDWLAENFENIERNSIDLTEVFEAFKKVLPDAENIQGRYLAEVNTRSRLRADALYAQWNEKNYLVVGTGNKVEDYGIWFFTKFGDWAVDLSPIGNLYKSEVYALAKYLGIIPSILWARPTDGLHPDWATDEDQIWATYDELEWAMVEYDNGKRKENFTGRDNKVMEIYSQRHEVNAHKMEMPPVFEI
jgi:NAD+ synthase